VHAIDEHHYILQVEFERGLHSVFCFVLGDDDVGIIIGRVLVALIERIVWIALLVVRILSGGGVVPRSLTGWFISSTLIIWASAISWSGSTSAVLLGLFVFLGTRITRSIWSLLFNFIFVAEI